MNTKEIIETLNNSFGYEDFMVTYNDMIENGTLKEIWSNPKTLVEFLKIKNEIKKRFHKKYVIEYPNKILRGFRELKYIYHVRENEFNNLVELFNKTVEPSLKQHYFNQRIKKLQIV